MTFAGTMPVFSGCKPGERPRSMPAPKSLPDSYDPMLFVYIIIALKLASFIMTV